MDQVITIWLTDYGWLAILLGSIFFGETVILAAAFLTHRGWWSFSDLFFLSVIGTVLSDIVCFFCAKFFSSILKKYETKKSNILKLFKNLERLTHGKTFWALLFIKFLYGTRVLFIFYLSLNKISFKKFVLFDILGTIIWLVALIALGYLSGAGINDLFSNVKRIELSLLAIVSLLIFIKIISKWLTNKITNK